jgi:D-3-phosphoglycerate dehydrogenase
MDRSGRDPTRRMTRVAPLNIIILDDYQDAVRKLKCASILEHLNTKVFTNTVKGLGPALGARRDADVLVLIRERSQFPRQLLEKLPKLKLISQTGRVGQHIDIETCTRLGIAVAEGVGSPVAPAELTWALIMAAMRRCRTTSARSSTARGSSRA